MVSLILGYVDSGKINHIKTFQGVIRGWGPSINLTVFFRFTGLFTSSWLPARINLESAQRLLTMRKKNMFRTAIYLILVLVSFSALGEAPCDVRIGRSLGVKVVEFGPGHLTYSKIPFRESSARALKEEMINLQDMGLCEERILSQKCTLKYEQRSAVNIITMYRGVQKWNSWTLNSKVDAQNYVKSLKLTGFCS